MDLRVNWCELNVQIENCDLFRTCWRNNVTLFDFKGGNDSTNRTAFFCAYWETRRFSRATWVTLGRANNCAPLKFRKCLPSKVKYSSSKLYIHFASPINQLECHIVKPLFIVSFDEPFKTNRYQEWIRKKNELFKFIHVCALVTECLCVLF